MQMQEARFWVKLVGVVSGALLFSAPPAFAWSRHDLITQAALSTLPESFQKLQLRVTPLPKLIQDLGFEDLNAFKKNLKIATDLAFPFKAKEQVGKKARWTQTLSTYSDEPDWGMDQELFESYPELWEAELSMMGGRVGAPSQAFRHMFWPFDFRHFFAGLKLPLRKLFTSMGHAPERAELWLIWSRRASERGHPYWSARFLANALHYLEDVTQPFHTAQTPSKRFLILPALRWSEWATAGEWVTKVTRIITYYHFAYEDSMGKILDASDPLSRPALRGRLLKALGGGHEAGQKIPARDEIQTRVRALAHSALSQAPEAARLSLRFFPGIQGSYLNLIPEKAQDAAWWKEVETRFQKKTAENEAYLVQVEELFRILGRAIREVCGAEGSSLLSSS